VGRVGGRLAGVRCRGGCGGVGRVCGCSQVCDARSRERNFACMPARGAQVPRSYMHASMPAVRACALRLCRESKRDDRRYTHRIRRRERERERARERKREGRTECCLCCLHASSVQRRDSGEHQDTSYSGYSREQVRRNTEKERKTVAVIAEGAIRRAR